MFQSVTSLIPMMLRIALMIFFVLLFDIYAYQAIRTLSIDIQPVYRRIIRFSFWALCVFVYVIAVMAFTGNLANISRTLMVVLFGFFMVIFLAKILMVLPLLMEDIYRVIHKIISLFKPSLAIAGEEDGASLMSRKNFISKISAGLGALTVTGMSYGIIRGAHHYKIHRTEVQFGNLPKSFRGLRIGQLSDIHVGSFWDKRAVEKGVEKLMKEKPDIIFFTGDLVNSLADEMTDDYIRIFSRVKAPMGVYSILGNHDYGDYHQWPDKTEFDGNHSQDSKDHMTPMQLANLDKVHAIHRQMGWDLLLNENRILTKDGESIALIGVENYGAKRRFARYGRLDKAYAGIEALPFKILLSHDPSHWESQVLKQYPDIDLTFAGHTHGAQFGIETAGFRWSPIEYMYKQWAGLYPSGSQYLYVNRGFGYLGYPGRLGIRPEIGIITLV